jgi:hypothetical protein
MSENRMIGSIDGKNKAKYKRERETLSKYWIEHFEDGSSRGREEDTRECVSKEGVKYISKGIVRWWRSTEANNIKSEDGL